jgi:uncharacterized protein (DUF1778 family)
VTAKPIKTDILTLRVSPDERERLLKAAMADDRPLSAWLRKIALEAADGKPRKK